MNDKLKNALLVVVGVTSVLSLAMLLVFLKPSVIVNNGFSSQQGEKSLLAGAPGNMLAENYDPYVMYNGGYNTNKDMNVGGTFTGVAATLTGTLTGVAANFSGAITATTATFSGLLKTDAGITRSYSLATTTSATTYTLTASDIGNYDTIRQTLSGGATTFTLPATSTLTSLVPTAGDTAETCWMPITNNLVFAAGTGIDMMVATSTNNGGGAYDLTITAGGVGCIKWFRQTDTDITAGLIEYEDAD
jgi:hypothetical protein